MNHIDILPFCICFIMPIAIVLITSIQKMYQNKQMTRLLEKAIDKDAGIDIERINDMIRKPRRTFRERLTRHLLSGCIFSLIGLVLIICGLVSWADGTAFSSDPVTVPLVFGGISLAIGLNFLIVFFVMRRQAQAGDEEEKK